MKKVLPILLIAVFLVSCSGQSQALSDSAMATKVAAILTAPATATSSVPTATQYTPGHCYPTADRHGSSHFRSYYPGNQLYRRESYGNR